MADFEIKRGDRLPVISSTLEDRSGAAITVPTGGASSVQFFMRLATAASNSAPKIAAAAVVADQGANKGLVSYPWQPGDTDVPGDYFAEWKVKYDTGEEQTYPTSGFIAIKINDDLESHLVALRIARQLGKLNLTPSAGDVIRIRRMIDDMSETSPMYTDETLTDTIIANLSLEAAAAQLWEEKAAAYLTLVNTAENGSSRDMGKLYTNALEMAGYYRRRADVLNPPDPRAGQRPMTRAIVRP